MIVKHLTRASNSRTYKDINSTGAFLPTLVCDRTHPFPKRKHSPGHTSVSYAASRTVPVTRVQANWYVLPGTWCGILQYKYVSGTGRY